jgi:hypothetical protein
MLRASVWVISCSINTKKARHSTEYDRVKSLMSVHCLSMALFGSLQQEHLNIVLSHLALFFDVVKHYQLAQLLVVAGTILLHPLVVAETILLHLLVVAGTILLHLLVVAETILLHLLVVAGTILLHLLVVAETILLHLLVVPGTVLLHLLVVAAMRNFYWVLHLHKQKTTNVYYLLILHLIHSLPFISQSFR